jgi:hypothetical protein
VPRQFIIGALFFAVVLGFSFYKIHHSSTDSPSSLSFSTPRGWQPTSSPTPFLEDTRFFQQSTGMELKTTLISTNNQAAVSIFVRSLAIAEDASPEDAMLALADFLKISPCSSVKKPLFANFVSCITTANTTKSTYALLIPVQKDRYFVIKANSNSANINPQDVVKRLVANIKITLHN